MDPHIRKEVSLDSKGPLGAISNLAAPQATTHPPTTSEANSAATSRTASKENLCEECIQNPLDLIDASIQVDLSDSESEEPGTDSVDGKEDAMGRSRRAGDLSVNKKGTPLYSREDIREQYCINDKELQVLDKSGRKGILGCFSNNGQPGLTPCTSGGGKGRKSMLLGSCIARSNSEEDLQELATKRPISPGHRGTTWNGRNYGVHNDRQQHSHHHGHGHNPDEDDGFDEHYFRRRPKSVCMSANTTADGRRFIPPTYGGAGLPPNAASAHLPPHNLGIPTEPFQPASLEDHHRMTMAYGPHPLMRAASPYATNNTGAPPPPTFMGGAPPPPPQQSQPQSTSGYPNVPSGPNSGGYTLPPTVAYFPVTAYGTPMDPSKQSEMMSQESLNVQQPNTPDLLMHRRQVDSSTLEDDRRGKHVSFDSSSLMRSQTLATMDEASFQRMAAAIASQNMASSPSKSSERLIDGRKTPDLDFYSQIFPPDLARQIMMDRMKRNAMRTQATQTDRGRNSAHISSPSGPTLPQKQQLPQFPPKVYMVSEGVQTNGFSRRSSSDTQTSPPNRIVRPPPQQQQQQPPLPPYQDPPPPPTPQSPPKKKPQLQPKPTSVAAAACSPHEVKTKPYLPPHIAHANQKGYQLQIYHLDGSSPSPKTSPPTPASSWYGTAPRSGKHQHHHSHHKHSHHNHHGKATRSHSSGNVLDENFEATNGSNHDRSGLRKPSSSTATVKVSSSSKPAEKCSKHLQKSLSEGKLTEEPVDDPSVPHPQPKPPKAVKFLHQEEYQPSNHATLLPVSNPSEDEVSDKDLPELAPITNQEYQQAVLKQSQVQSQESSEKNDEDQESVDLGKTLSPLGSTSSLQDLIESSSARGSVDPMIKSTQSSAWIERERSSKKTDESTSKKSVVVIEPPLKVASASEAAVEAETDPTMTLAVAKQKLAPSQRMDSVTSAKTNETSTTATSDDYATAPETQTKSNTTEEDEMDEEMEEVEKVEHYLETPSPDEQPQVPANEEEEEDEKLSQQQYSAVCEIQLKSNTDSGLEISESKMPKSPTHSFASSSSGSYSVHNNTENGTRKISPPSDSKSSNKEKPAEKPSPPPPQPEIMPTEQTDLPEKPTQIEMSNVEVDLEKDEAEMQLNSTSDVEVATSTSSEEKPLEAEPEFTGGETDKLKERKQELKLELDVNAPPQMLHNLQATTSSERSDGPLTSEAEESSENSMIWQRVPMGTGDVMRKRQAFEQQIKAQSMDNDTKYTSQDNNKAASSNITTVNKVARKIMSEDAASISPGLARSPAMHQGFRQEEWIVERTPVNTPDTANDKVVIAMINLSDEETSNHVDSDVVFKSSTAATTPQEGSLMSSLGPSSVDLNQDQPSNPSQVQESVSAPANLGDQQDEQPLENEDEQQPTEDQEDEKLVVVEAESEVKKIEAAEDGAVPEPPAGFGDSPVHQPKAPQAPPEFHEAIIDQALPQEEQLIVASEASEAVPVMVTTTPAVHITEAFQPKTTFTASEASVEAVFTVKKESVTPTLETTSASLIQSLEKQQQQPRKLSTASSVATAASRPSSKNASSHHSSRSRSSSKERLLSTLAGSETAPQTTNEVDEVEGLYCGGYEKTTWAFIGKLSPASSQGHDEESKMVPLQRSDSLESTQSEREFRKKYQAITHRMVHRKSSAVMYSRILERTFECNKNVRVLRVRGEFGFRIHGSRPVVVSAIEPHTPAQSSGLEVGDIILTINGINVLDLPHTEVVKTAQTGCDELELGLARVQDLSELRSMDPMNLAYVRLDDSMRILISGYLWKLSRSMVPTTTPGCASALISKWSRRFFVLRADSCLYFFKKEQESRPLGATLVSGCVIAPGCEDHDQDSGVAKPFSFRLKLATSSILCLAADNQEDYDQWMHSVQHSSAAAQTPNKPNDDLWMEMCRQKMKMTPLDYINADCQGYLQKLDGHSKSWKKRFCILSDACLYLYVDKESESALASLCLHGYRVQSTGNIGGNRKHTFELIPPDPNLKYFYFVAETETEKKRWLASFEYSIDRWMKLS